MLPRISGENALIYEANKLLDSQAKGESNVLGALKNDKIIGVVVYEKMDLDTKHFGFGIGRIPHLLARGKSYQQSVAVKNALLQTAIHELGNLGIRCIISRISSKDSSSIHTLEKGGFFLMDTIMTFFTEMENMEFQTKKTEIEIKPFKDSDIKGLMAIASQAFKLSHFHADPKFPRKKCDELYEKWVENCCRGLADEVLVANLNGMPVAFVTCRKERDASEFFKINIGVIDLIAVSKKFQGHGIGHDLMISALEWFNKNKIHIAKIGAQSQNIPAIRLYQGTGFLFLASELTLHKWI